MSDAWLAPVAEQIETTEAVLREVFFERQRQIQNEDWSLKYDDMHVEGELAFACAAYAAVAACSDDERVALGESGRWGFNRITAIVRALWPDRLGRFKPKNRRRDLIRSLALGVAEIERLDRVGKPK